MIKEINMPMMAPTEGGSSDESTVAWEDIPAAGPVDIQSGRNVYIEFNEEATATKASAGKILQFIKEGYMPIAKYVSGDPSKGTFITWGAGVADLSVASNEYILGLVAVTGRIFNLYAYSDALEKPFTTVRREPSGGASSEN